MGVDPVRQPCDAGATQVRDQPPLGDLPDQVLRRLAQRRRNVERGRRREPLTVVRELFDVAHPLPSVHAATGFRSSIRRSDAGSSSSAVSFRTWWWLEEATDRRA